MKNLSTGLLALSALLALNSCVSTTTLEPEPAEKGKTSLVFNLLPDEEAATRADNHDGYKLRYIATLYSGRATNITQSVTPQRKEIIDGEISSLGNKNQLIFDVDRDNYYTLIVFADYIPSDYKYNEEKGGYDDYFFNTTDFGREVIQMLSYPGDKNSLKDNKIIELSPDFFNNDNYDCFGGVAVTPYPKTEEKIELNLQLYRMVAKVRFEDITEMSGKLDVVINGLTYYSRFSLRENADDASAYADVSINTTNVKLSTNKDFKGEEKQEIFYFYTFASSDKSQTPKINFTLTDSKGENKDIDVKVIPVKRNQITTVRGYLFPGYIPPEEPGDGPLILNTSHVDPESWSNDTSLWPSN